jgi:hypothetical protein
MSAKFYDLTRKHSLNSNLKIGSFNWRLKFYEIIIWSVRHMKTGKWLFMFMEGINQRCDETAQFKATLYVICKLAVYAL